MAPRSNMKKLARCVAIFGLTIPGSIAFAPLSDTHTTETAPPQELGSMTSDGMYVYSMNYCTIVQNIQCKVSLSTGGPVPETTPVYSPVPGGNTASTGVETKTAAQSVPAGGSGGYSSGPGGAPKPSVSIPGESGPAPSGGGATVTSGAYGATISGSGVGSGQIPTGTNSEGASSTMSAPPLASASTAAAVAGAAPGAAMGLVGVLAVALL